MLAKLQKIHFSQYQKKRKSTSGKIETKQHKSSNQRGSFVPLVIQLPIRQNNRKSTASNIKIKQQTKIAIE